MRLHEGPRREPPEGRARALVVLLHGYGADGNDLIDLAEAWASLLPDTAFVAPHAPEPCAMAPVGQQWFALTVRDPHERWQGVVAARPGLDAVLDAELERYGLPDAAMALVGFSQGAMMALHAGLRRSRSPAAIIGYSGMLVGPERLAAEVTARPPVLLVHGTHDEIVPVQALPAAVAALGEAAIPCEWHLSQGLGHGIDDEGLRLGGRFMASRLLGAEDP